MIGYILKWIDNPRKRADMIYWSLNKLATASIIKQERTLSEDPLVLIVMTMGLRSQMAERIVVLFLWKKVSFVLEPGVSFLRTSVIRAPVMMSHNMKTALP